jgi:two-component system chemotaxis response regulator CheB
MADMDGAVVALQNLPPSFSESFAQYLNERCGCQATALDEGMLMHTGQCYVGVQGETLLVKKNAHLPMIDTQAPDDGLESIDRFLQSAASVFGRELAVVLLSGANPGDQTGLRIVKEHHGRVILRKRSSCMVSEPLDSVADSGLADTEVNPEELLQTVLNGFEKKVAQDVNG